MQGKRAARQMELDADVNGRRWRKRERESEAFTREEESTTEAR